MPTSTGGFYQDEMGETECKYCGTGTYVSEERHPGKSATDCWACPYGRYCAIFAPYVVVSDKDCNQFCRKNDRHGSGFESGSF